ncbi:DUF6653 family protein [Haloarchaeobius amylolyticus]|uniref:DUF6653 family protein n=1 Tax=Haloarchaeobius amylolyticus TaxID=1198296 RepID=UPI00226E07AD|nr:DUF6653 family protein [Haloarchaeobius amylolyticus]
MTADADPTPRLAERLFWSGHANPWSVWTFVATYPLLVLAIYRRERRLLAAILVFVAVNPVLSPEPDDDSAWATRVVLGERVWLDEGLLSSVADLLFVACCAPVQLYTLRAAVKRRPVRTAVGTALSLVLMFVFFGRMAQLYEDRAREMTTV